MGVIEGDSIPQVAIPKFVAYYKRYLFPFNKLIKICGFDQINNVLKDLKKGA